MWMKQRQSHFNVFMWNENIEIQPRYNKFPRPIFALFIYLGEFECRQSGGISIVKWMDNRSVLVVTSICGPMESGIVQRRLKGQPDKVPVTCPLVVQDYNAHMGGVDLLDQKIVPYSLDRRSKVKFYLRPFFDLMDVAMTNSYIVWCKVNPDSKLTSLQFRRSVTRDLITVYGNRSVSYYTKQSKKRGASSQLPTELHLPEFDSSSRKRCRLCAEKKLDFKTVFKCSGCDAPILHY